MLNNDNQNNKKWIPYFLREDSIYKKHPFLAWSISIIVILVSLYGFHIFGENLANNAAYNAGRREALKYYNIIK